MTSRYDMTTDDLTYACPRCGTGEVRERSAWCATCEAEEPEEPGCYGCGEPLATLHSYCRPCSAEMFEPDAPDAVAP